jgi:hypothetical protein
MKRESQVKVPRKEYSSQGNRSSDCEVGNGVSQFEKKKDLALGVEQAGGIGGLEVAEI